MVSPLVSTLKQIEVIGGGKREDVLWRMPGCMKNLLVKVEAVNADFVLATFASCADTPRPQRLQRWLGSITPYTWRHRDRNVGTRSFQDDVVLQLSVKHAEEVVVRTSHNMPTNIQSTIWQFNTAAIMQAFVNWELISIFSSKTCHQQQQHLFNSLLSRTTWVSRHQKGGTIRDFNEARDDGVASGISWTVCKSSALRSRPVTTPAPYHSVFTGWILFLPPNQPCQSTDGKY